MLNLKQNKIKKKQKPFLGMAQTWNAIITWDSEAEAITFKARGGCGGKAP